MAVFTGLVSLVFALIIFIAESIRDGKNPEQRRVLLEISFLWPIAAFTSLALLNFLWFKVVILSLIFPIIISISIVYSFWRVINNLIDPEARENERVKMVKERIKKIIFESIRERIGNNILFGKVGKDKDIKLEYTFSKSWLDESASRYIFIESKEEGWLSDINFLELNKLVNVLENAARQMGFSLYLESSPTLESGEEGQDARKSGYKSGFLKKAYLLKRYGEHLPPSSIFTEGSKVILALPKEFNGKPSLIDYVNESISHIFRFKKNEPASEIFRRELQGTKDQLVTAIRSESLGSIEELKQTYLDLAESFLETLHEFGGGFSYEQAGKERGNFFEGWNEIRWLNQDIRELIIVAMSSDNRDVISNIIFLPTAIAVRAIQARDHLLFQEFVDFSPFIYYLTKDKPDGELKSFVINRSWKYLKELSSFYIDPKLEDRHDSRDIKKLEEYKNFALYILKVFQSMLKDSFERKDEDTFETVIDEFLKLHKHFDPENDHPDSKHLEMSLQWEASEQKKSEIKKRIDFQKEKEKISRRIKLAKEQVLFGLTGKILEKYNQSRQDDILKKFFENAVNKLPSDIKRLAKVFDSSRNFKTEDFWGWDNWEMIPDGEVRSIDVSGKLDTLFCVKSLQILGGKSEEEIKSIKLPHSRSFAYLADDNPSSGALIAILNAIASKPEEWRHILTDIQISKIEAFKKIIKESKEAQEKSEEEYLKTAVVDEDKLKEFKRKLHEEFKKTGHIRPIANKLKIYRDLTSQNPKKKIPSWGYNQIDAKAAFIKKWHVHYSEWGEQYGQGMASSEDQIAFEVMIDGVGSKKEVNKQNVIQEVEDVVLSGKLKNPIIFQTLDHLFEYEQIKKSELFISNYHQDCPKTEFDGFSGYMGVLKLKGSNVPVIDLFIHKKELKNKLVITDFEGLGTWNQYSPIDNPEDNNYKDGIFLLRISDLNKENGTRSKIITENPAWLQKYDDKDGYLRQHVIIKLYQKFKFEIKNPALGYCFDVIDEVKTKTNN